MKTFLAALLLCACAASAAAQDAHNAHPQKQEQPTPQSAPTLRGEATAADTKRVSFADALQEPQKYADKAVVIEGVVTRVCQAEGCWMEIGPKSKGDGSIRVTFDHTFAVPKD